jgi:hypothetical protein
MAASKHSGAVEYSARVLLGLRSVKGKSDMIEVDVAKNKHSPGGEQFFLRVDRATQTLFDVAYEAPPKPDKTEVRATKFETDCQVVLECIPHAPKSIDRVRLEAALAAKGAGCSVNTLNKRVAKLIDDGQAADLSGGSKGTAPQYTRLTSVITSRDQS